MGIFDFFKRADIDRGVQAFLARPGGVLLDVRTREEYRQGHIPGSKNVDVGEIQRAADLWPDRSTPLFVYCHSGARSGQAAFMLKKLGYADVTNIGGIMDYHGQIER